MRELSIAVGSFFILLCFLHWAKPSLVYTPTGALREFGVGYRKKTVLPMWLVVLVLAILCYGTSIYFFS